MNIEITNFGCLRDIRFELKPGLTHLIGVNESGKSSLLRCLNAALRKIKLNPSDISHGVEGESYYEISTLTFSNDLLSENVISAIKADGGRLPKSFRFVYWSDGDIAFVSDTIKAEINASLLSELMLEINDVRENNNPNLTRLVTLLNSPPRDLDSINQWYIDVQDLYSAKLKMSTDISELASIKDINDYIEDQSISLMRPVLVTSAFHFSSSYNLDEISPLTPDDPLYHLFRVGNIPIDSFKEFFKTSTKTRTFTFTTMQKIANFLNSNYTYTNYHIRADYLDGVLSLFITDDIDDNPVSLESRSIGFNRLIAYYVLLYSVSLKNEKWLVMFDEPSESLHPSAQDDLYKTILNVFDGKSEKYALIATHSPYMIDPANPRRVLVLDRQKVDVAGLKAGSTKLVSLEKDDDKPIQVIRDSLGLSLIQERLGVGNRCAVCEGYTEYYILDAALKKLLPKHSFNLISAGGAGNVAHFVNIIAGWNIPVVAVLDNDPAGRDAALKIKNNQMLSKNVIFISEVSGYTIEDIFSYADYRSAVVNCAGSIASEVEKVLAIDKPGGQKNYQYISSVLAGNKRLRRPDKLEIAQALGRMINSDEIEDSSKRNLNRVLEEIESLLLT
jgi:predicted ATPase